MAHFTEQFKQRYRQEKGESDQDFELRARQYAKDQITRDRKHLQAYLKGRRFFVFKKQVFPVIDSEFLREKNIIPIENHEQSDSVESRL